MDLTVGVLGVAGVHHALLHAILDQSHVDWVGGKQPEAERENQPRLEDRFGHLRPRRKDHVGADRRCRRHPFQDWRLTNRHSRQQPTRQIDPLTSGNAYSCL